ncbi:enamine deaminase RidA (YjgF/YER057c/UK114 family) [Litoreibacter ponti]|uniref:Enamine deaminase RidA (YjgF/YER057c/UK114 family) n=1 Tax=Litoreibacter ponti TaxID=1510457 RepID=A0A2T6BJP5_9RHOB|nr:RidA family protein [Litoreibacter ponti]PTX56276.1 enamine deaminase RidA (YjgF/YER057c/UK114 family) [Litoreibacter ponti]
MIKRIFSGGPFEPKVGYCRAVVAGDWIHMSGTVCGTDHETGEDTLDPVRQCEGALKIIEKALNEAGASFADTVRVTYVLPDAAEFEACWPALRAAFGDNPPAAMMTEAGLIDPRFRIEIEVTAYKPRA